MNLDIVIFGLSITSSWGNGHASTYRALVKALARRGHRVTFLERDVPWYREHRDLENPDYCAVELYQDLPDVARRFGGRAAEADMVIVGSYVPDGIVLGDWATTRARGVTAFYDIDTPVTLSKLEAGGTDYISAALIPRFDLFLSFTGGPTLRWIEERYGSPRARPLYCAADLDFHAPSVVQNRWELGYLGTYSADRHPALQRLLVEPARQRPDGAFVVAGAQYPDDILWPANVARFDHLTLAEHSSFYGAQRFTLNVTRADMATRGYSPSVRLFEAAACGVPIISDRWPGLDTFFTSGTEILVADDTRDVTEILANVTEERRRAIAMAARKRLLASHTADRRAKDLEDYYQDARSDATVAIKEVVA
jgi:spore maturation protein CgeB